jgi:uncharacterized Rossmann fold enzyme
MGNTTASKFWNEDGHYIFDPWNSREGAETIHSHGHTRWAEAIFDNWVAKNFTKPAFFDWSGQTVYLVGRGVSLDWAAKHLNKRKRKGVAIVLNHACENKNLKIKKQDFVMVVDDRAEKTILSDVSDYRLIGCPCLKESFISRGWREIYGYTLWPDAPLNRFMRKLFPGLPELNEMMSVSVCAMHLAALNGAKRIVLVGHDHADGNGKLTFSWAHGMSVKTNLYLAKLSQAIASMAYFITQHTGAEVVNCSKIPIVGYDMMADGEAKILGSIKHGRLPDYIE